MHDIFWGLPVIGYLFLGGMGACAVSVSASVLLRRARFGPSRFWIAKAGALIGPPLAIGGTIMIVFELGRMYRALNLFKLVNLSPMNIGSWLLMFFIVISLLYALTFLPPSAGPGDRLAPIRKALAWLCLPIGLSVAVYTGVLLGAMPSRPFWNSPIIAFLFTVSALSTGIAAIVATAAVFRRRSDDPELEEDFEQSSYMLVSSDAVLLVTELVIIFLFIMFAHLTVGSVKEAISVILAGGQYAAPFWGLVVLVGILFPLIVELAIVLPKLLWAKKYRTNRFIEFTVAVAILVGGFSLRYVIVMAGQVTGPVGL